MDSLTTCSFWSNYFNDIFNNYPSINLITSQEHLLHLPVRTKSLLSTVTTKSTIVVVSLQVGQYTFESIFDFISSEI